MFALKFTFLNLNFPKTRESIDKYCEKFEKDMLYLFDKCYRKGDPKMMHVSLILIQPTHNTLVSCLSNSIALKPSWISMVVHLVCKYMSINTTFSSTRYGSMWTMVMICMLFYFLFLFCSNKSIISFTDGAQSRIQMKVLLKPSQV